MGDTELGKSGLAKDEAHGSETNDKKEDESGDGDKENGEKDEKDEENGGLPDEETWNAYGEKTYKVINA